VPGGRGEEKRLSSSFFDVDSSVMPKLLQKFMLDIFE
jgi:hypothetical protein